MTDYQRCEDAITSAAGLVKVMGTDAVAKTVIDELQFTFKTVAELRAYIRLLERALSEYVILGNGRCIIGAPLVAMGRAALAAKP